MYALYVCVNLVICRIIDAGVNIRIVYVLCGFLAVKYHPYFVVEIHFGAVKLYGVLLCDHKRQYYGLCVGFFLRRIL